MSYAQGTSVSPEKSQAEIQSTLRKYGASKFGVMEDETGAHVLFQFSNLMIQMSVPLPARAETKFIKTPSGRVRNQNQQRLAYDQDIKEKWRALMLAIKAKLVAVESGVSTVEKEFMAWVVMPDGKPLSDHILPHLEECARSGKMPSQFLRLTA